jgi:Rad3-related DNA helicase
VRQDFEEWIAEDHKVFHAADIEEDLSAFTGEKDALLVLTNRYDGIDLPDDDCRLVIIYGLPSRGDSQERFLAGALGAMDVLQERVRARIVQGAGRATRNEDDYAAVVMLGDDLAAFCTRRDVLNAMRPEVNAEISFGLENSLDTPSTEMTENFQVLPSPRRRLGGRGA